MTQETETPKQPEKAKATSKSAWKRAAVHDGVTLPSGSVVSIKLPNIAKLIKAGQIPNDLIDAAIEFQGARKVTRQMIEDQWDYIEHIVPLTLVDPKVEAEDVADIPPEDLDLIAAFIGRTEDTDAIGHHLGGLEASADWRRFRGRLTAEEVAELV